MIIPFVKEDKMVQNDCQAIACNAVVTQSASMRKLISQAIRAAGSTATVLLTGESGTGKELFARIVHEHSSRRSQELVRVNCAALPANLIESELFGHEKGAFTDAAQKRIGRFEHAEGGTLLLDEITEIPITTQAKLLRSLEENEFQRVGSNQTIRMDTRIVATSNRDILSEVVAGKFRLDLYHRLNVIELKIPALRERSFDIPLLVTHFIERFKSESQVAVKGFTNAAMRLLCEHQWPGNIRELRNTIHRASVLTDRRLIDANCLSHLSNPAQKPSTQLVPESWLSFRLDEIEKQIILASIAKFGSKRLAAEKLGVSPRTISNKLKNYGSDSLEKVA